VSELFQRETSSAAKAVDENKQIIAAVEPLQHPKARTK
jgi:hypothetical protein